MFSLFDFNCLAVGNVQQLIRLNKLISLPEKSFSRRNEVDSILLLIIFQIMIFFGLLHFFKKLSHANLFFFFNLTFFIAKDFISSPPFWYSWKSFITNWCYSSIWTSLFNYNNLTQINADLAIQLEISMMPTQPETEKKREHVRFFSHSDRQFILMSQELATE